MRAQWRKQLPLVAGEDARSSGTVAWGAVLSCLLCVWLIAGPVRAQDREPHSGNTTRAQQEEAARLTARGEQLYLSGEFAAALEAYREAYLAVPAPELLFNLGQCHRQLHDYGDAAFFFRVYLRERPHVAHRSTVESLVVESLRRRTDATTTGPRRHQNDDTKPLASPNPESAPEQLRDETALRRKRWAWGVASAVLLAGGSAVLAATLSGGGDGGTARPDASLGVLDWR